MATTKKNLFFSLLLLPLLTIAAPSDKIAVLNLKNTSGVSAGEAELLSDRLRNDLFSTGRVKVMERDQMQSILTEQGLQQSGVTCTDEGCMVEFGKLLGVKTLISGSIGKLGSLFMINAKSIDVQTGQIIKVVSEDVHGEIEDVVDVLPTVAAKLTGASVPVKHSPKKRTSPAPQPQPSSESYDPLPCNGSIFLEKVYFVPPLFTFTVPSDETDDINEELAEAISDALDRDVLCAPNERIAATSCKTLTIRIVPTKYETKPAARKQITGTIYTDVSIYSSPKAGTPIVTVKFKNTGDRHWGDITPLENAFEELAESLEDDLYSAAKEPLKNAGFRR